MAITPVRSVGSHASPNGTDTLIEARGRPRFSAAGGWPPALLTTALTLVILRVFGVGVGDLGAFCGHLLLCVVLPGILLWRALRGGAGPLVGDVVGGTVLGYALQVLAYLGARAVGLPLLVLALPAGVLATFVAVGRLRRYWRGSGERVPTGWSWSVAGVVLFVVAWSAVTFYRQHGLDWPAVGSPYKDMTFHLALVGELKHHLPPTIPYVLGEPLRYHWFVYADMAATSWVTGIEPHLLLIRLSLLPMAVLFTVGVALLAGHLVGSVGFGGVRGSRRGADGSVGVGVPGAWWAGPLAAFLTFAAIPPSPYPWVSIPVPEGRLFGPLWYSPTQTFGAVLAVPAVLLLTELLRAERIRAADAGRWAMLAVLIAVITGAKATYLPMLVAALLLVIVVRWVFTRTVPGAAVLACALAVAGLAFAQLVLFAGFTGGLLVKPFATAQLAPVSQLTGLADPGVGGPWPVVLPLAVALLCWLLIGGGSWVVLLSRVRWVTDPAVLLCAGILVAGLCAMLAFDHPGESQTFFLNSARPAFACLVVAGLAVGTNRWLGRPHAASRWTRWAPAAGLAAGVVSVCLLRLVGDPSAPTRQTVGGIGLVLALVWPFLALAGISAAMCLAVLIVGRRRRGLRALALPVLLLFWLGVGLPGAALRFGPTSVGWRDPRPPPSSIEIYPSIPPGALEASRWLRDHSEPTDLVATNAHCLPMRDVSCDNRSFWVSAYTERRVLVSGWGYTVEAHERARLTGESPNEVPYWRPQRLVDNDAAFTSPSAASVDRLRERYGVRWLLAYHRSNRPPAALGEFARWRFSAGECAVYELVRPV